MVRSVAGLGVLWGSALFASPAGAELATFYVDPAQSRLTLSGGIANPASFFGFFPVGPGSMEAAFGGTIVADRDGSSLTVSGGSSITALANPGGPFLPAGPGNVDVFGMVTNSFNGTANNRMYDVVLDLVSGSLSHGSAFSGNVAFIGGGGIFPFFRPDPLPLVYFPVSNFSASAISLTSDGTVETLTIPIDTNLFATSDDRSYVLTRLTGTLVATSVVPAPAATALLGMAGLVMSRRRR
jgi:hypothetical protein